MTEVMNEWPSGATAMSASSVGPLVICCGVPFGKDCLQMCRPFPPASDVKYIHLPSGDQAAEIHAAFCGPTDLAAPPLNGTSLQGPKSRVPISVAKTHCPSEDRYELCDIPVSRGGTYTSRSSARLSVEVTMAKCQPLLTSLNITWWESVQVSPLAFESRTCGCPPSTGTTTMCPDVVLSNTA